MSEQIDAEWIQQKFAENSITTRHGLAILIKAMLRLIVMNSDREDLDRNVKLACEALIKGAPRYYDIIKPLFEELENGRD